MQVKNTPQTNTTKHKKRMLGKQKGPKQPTAPPQEWIDLISL
jgi:hypothetical protein